MRPDTKLKTMTIPYHRQKRTHYEYHRVDRYGFGHTEQTSSRRPTAPRARARSVSIRRWEQEWCVRATLDARDANDSIGLARPRARVVVGRRRSSATRARDGVLPGVFAIARARMGDARRRAREGMTRERATRKRWMDIVDADGFARDGVEGRRRARDGRMARWMTGTRLGAKP